MKAGMDSAPATKDQAVPAVIAAAGPAACAAWEEFLGGAGLGASSRIVYRQRAAQFLRWLSAQGLDLMQVTPALMASYLDGLSDSPHARMTYRTPLRRLFDSITAHGVIASNPTRVSADAGRSEAPACGADATGHEEGRPTLADLIEFLLELDGIREGSRSYRPGLVAMYPVVVGGMDPQAIASFTGVPLDEVETYVARLRENGVWTPDGKVALDSADPDVAEFVVNLVLIIGCAGGIFQRFPPPGDADNPSTHEPISADLPVADGDGS